jgi:hypothetical protein
MSPSYIINFACFLLMTKVIIPLLMANVTSHSNTSEKNLSLALSFEC